MHTIAGVLSVAFSLFLLPASVVAQISDTTPPTLVTLSFMPTSVDVTAGPQTVTVTARVTDNLAGVQFSFFGWFIRPSGGGFFPSGSFFQLTRISGTPLDGVYQGTATIPQYSEPGVWKLDLITISDLATNRVNVTNSDLQARQIPTDLTVKSDPDNEVPRMTGVSVSPAVVDVSSGPQNVVLTLTLTDNLAGVGGASATFTSPSGRQQQSPDLLRLVSGTPLNGTWRGSVMIPQYGEAGTWKLLISVGDNAGNSGGIAGPNLTLVSSPSDTAPPVIGAFHYSPSIIDTSAGPQTITVRLNLTDDLSGLDLSADSRASCFVCFTSPSGLQGVCSHFFRYLAGTARNGNWEVNITFPQFSETGTWKVSAGQIKDAARNWTSFSASTLAAAGFPTDLVVYRPSGPADGMIGPGGGTVTDGAFGARAAVTAPSGVLPGNTDVAIDVLASSLGVPTPSGFSTGSLFVNVNLSPTPPMPFASPGLTIVLPLPSLHTPGTVMNLYRLDPATGVLVPAPAVSPGTGNVTGTANTDGLSATFNNVGRLSTVVAFVPTAVLGDVNSDGRVDCVDLSIVKASFGKRTGQPGFDPRADLNRNDVVDISDLGVVSRQLPSGTICP